MSEYLGDVEQYKYHAEVVMDQVFENGQKLMYLASVDVSVRRPDRLRVDVDSDLKKMSFWFDGKLFALLGRKTNYYATAEAPPTIDAALDHMGERFGATPPLSDFMVSDPYAALTDRAKSGSYIGLYRVKGVMCHHLAFMQKSIDWQIWIEDGKMSVPRMLVITYKQVQSSPQYVAVLSNWDLSPKLPDSLFTFVAPEGADRIEFLPTELPMVPGEEK
jgi:hypothetical protein